MQQDGCSRSPWTPFHGGESFTAAATCLLATPPSNLNDLLMKAFRSTPSASSVHLWADSKTSSLHATATKSVSILSKACRRASDDVRFCISNTLNDTAADPFSPRPKSSQNENGLGKGDLLANELAGFVVTSFLVALLFVIFTLNLSPLIVIIPGGKMDGFSAPILELALAVMTATLTSA